MYLSSCVLFYADAMVRVYVWFFGPAICKQKPGMRTVLYAVKITVREYVYRCIRSSRDRYWSIFMPRFGFFWKVYASEPLVCNYFSLKYYI